MDFQKGDLVVYENREANTGMKRACLVVGFNGDWILDAHAGSHLSSSFRLKDVIVWEHHRAKKK